MKTKKDKRTVEQKRADLDKEVAELRRREDAGEKLPSESRDELIARINADRNVVCLGDVIKEMLPSIEKSRLRWEGFCESIIERLNSIEKEHCEDHPEVELQFDIDQCLGKSHIAGNLVVIYLPCPFCNQQKRQSSQLAKLLALGIPEKVVHAMFDNFQVLGDPDKAKALGKFRRQTARGLGFIIALGNVGTGKSHLAAATIKESGGDGLFITEHDLIGALRQSYSDNTGADEFVDKFRLTKVLVLDELTSDVTGKDVTPLLYRILGYRHDKNLLTVITSNESLAECIKIIGPKLHDRMRENYTVVNFPWASYRQPNATI